MTRFRLLVLCLGLRPAPGPGLHLFLFLGLMCLLGGACTPVNELSDEASLQGFTVQAVAPEAVRLLEVRLEDDRVVVPVDFGKYLFPITLHCSLQFAEEPAALLGIRTLDTLVFDSFDQTHLFHLVAPSGVAHPYTVLLEEVPHSEEAAVTSFALESCSPQDPWLLREPGVDAVRSRLTLPVFRGDFPYRVVPRLEVSPGARLCKPLPEEGYVFHSVQDSYEIEVESESGFVRSWTLALVPLQEVREPGLLAPEVLQRLSPRDLQCAFLAPQMQLTRMDVHQALCTVALEARPKTPPFPLTVQPLFSLSSYGRLLGRDTLVFAAWEATDTLFFADMLTAQVCPWVFRLSPWLNSQAQVEDFRVEAVHSPQGEMAVTGVVLEAQAGRIVLETSGFDFPLSLTDYRMVLSEDAEAVVDGPLVFATHESVAEFVVRASDGTEKTWQVGLQVTLPSGHEVLDFAIRDFTAGSGLALGTPVLDAQARRIVLPLTAGTVEDFPLQLGTCAVQVSPHAQVLLPPDLTFAHYTDSLSFTVRAFDGGSSSWTLALQPWFLLGKDLLSLAVEAYHSAEGRVVLGKVVLDPVKQEVGLELLQGYDFPLVLDRVQTECSPGAQVVETAQWVFAEARSVLPLTVRAQSGETSAWQLRLLDRRTAGHEAEVEYYQITGYQGTSHTAHNLVLRPQAVVDTAARRITLQIEDWGHKLPLRVQGLLGITHGARLEADFDLQHSLVFERLDQEYTFTVVSESGETRRAWTLGLEDLGPDRGADHRLLEYALLSYAGTSETAHALVMDPTPRVDSAARRITLGITDWATKLPLRVEAQWKAAEGATGSVPEVHTWVFDRLDQVQEFTLTSEDGAHSARWEVVLENRGPDRGKAAELTDFNLVAYQGTTTTANNLVLDARVARDEAARTLTLTVTDWPAKLPLTVETSYAVSPEAVVSPAEGPDRQLWVFETLDQKHSFTVTSPDGTVQETWALCLENRARVRSSQAQVTGFAFTEVPPGFVLDEKILEPSKGRITLVVRERPSAGAVLAIHPTVRISEGASLVGHTSGEPLSLGFGQPKTFEVVAEDETRKTWEVALVYGPQFPNSDFEQWIDDKGVTNLWPSNGKGWTTSNNSQVAGSSRAEGYKGWSVCNRTTLKSMNLIVYKVTSLASGACFLGNFTLKMSAADVANPRSMTRFALPLAVDTNPVGFSVYYKYLPKSPRVMTAPKTGALIPGFHDPVQVEGPDMAVFSVDVCHSQDPNFEYFVDRKNDRIAYAEVLESRTVSEWTLLTQYLTPEPGREHLPMTHISVRFASSYEGDYFKGADGSTLYVDEFKLLYYQPAEDAVRLP